jgi:hypothetical protein
MKTLFESSREGHFGATRTHTKRTFRGRELLRVVIGRISTARAGCGGRGGDGRPSQRSSAEPDYRVGSGVALLSSNGVVHPSHTPTHRIKLVSILPLTLNKLRAPHRPFATTKFTHRLTSTSFDVDRKTRLDGLRRRRRASVRGCKRERLLWMVSCVLQPPECTRLSELSVS